MQAGAAIAMPAAPGSACGRPQAEGRIRVLIVDDSAVVRTMLTRILDQSGRFDVVGQAPTVAVAEALLADRHVDIILLDVEMPGVDGLTALPGLIVAGAGARVVIVSSFCADGAASTIRALARGAADTLLKPGAVSMGQDFAETLVGRLARIGRVSRSLPRAPRPDPAPPPPPQRAPARRGAVDCIAIGASTGGIHALAAFFASLPRTVDTPILVTQHLPAPFMPFFATQLADASGRPAQVAADGVAVLPGTLLVAPGDGHLTLVRTRADVRVRIDRTPVANGSLPSVDPMMASVGAVYGVAAVGIMLSGMGRDGAIGAGQLVAAGGELLVQDQASSVVWGMPGTVARAGLASELAPPAALAAFLAQRIAGGATPWN